jgi:manganese/zinc/iron transport system substrate-binding protein
MLKFAFFICLLFSSCNQEPSSLNTWMTNNGKIKVLSTTAIIDDIVGRIGGERIDHLALINGEIDPHSYELVKGDDEKLNRAQVIFYNGLGLEHGASLRYFLEHRPEALPLGKKILDNHPEAVLVRKNQIDPHVWMDIPLWMEVVDPIVEELSKLDPTYRDYFVANGKQMKEEMEKTHAFLVAKLSSVPASRKYLVTSHDAFNYFTRRYLGGEERFRAPEGLAPDGQLSCADIQGIVDHLCHFQITVVFPESNVSKDALKKIVSACKEKGLHVKIAKEVLHADTLGQNSYLKMMEHNVDILVQEWE